MKFNKFTPIIKQYLNIKSKYLDVLLFYQIGDFYELFYDDAKKISSLLNLTLTKKNFVNHENVPMAGIPVSSSSSYISKLIKLGESIVICNQVGDYERDGKFKSKLIERKVVRIITPGTISEDIYLNEKKDNIIAAVWSKNKLDNFGYSILDISSGRFCVYELDDLYKLKSELLRTNPVELLYPDNFFRFKIIKEFGCLKSFSECEFGFKRTYNILLDHFNVVDLCCFGINANHLGIRPAGFMLDYVKYTQSINLSHINKIELGNLGRNIFMDFSTIKNLEIVDSLYGIEKNTLFYVLNSTLTPMGYRMLKRWILSPVNDVSEINRRHNIMDIIKSDVYYIRDIICGIGDLERILGRIVLKNIKVKDLLNFKKYLLLVLKLSLYLKKKSRVYIFDYIISNISVFDYLIDLIDKSIKPDVDSFDFGDFNKIILDGYNSELDGLRFLFKENKNFLNLIEKNEKKNTNIKSLCLKYSKIHGYFFQLKKSDVKLLPDYYIFYQSLKSCVRYIIPELSKCENKLINIKKKLIILEKKLLNNILDIIILNVDVLKNVFDYVSQLDILVGFVYKSINCNYVKPIFVNNSVINMINGRHPVLEVNLDFDFVANNLIFDDNIRLLLITGPNMAGKSTYMRQVALICIMSYIGCYVPADDFIVGPIDKILTRIGFSDDIVSGKSTFMMEMNDVSNIINNSTSNSLVLIDEMGRGTSVNEGISLAWACLEYIIIYIKSMTLFSTHYLELTKMEKIFVGIKNVYFDFLYREKCLILLYKLKFGVCLNSYGFDVACKSGIPKSIVKSSLNKLKELNSNKYFNFKIDKFNNFCFNVVHKKLIDRIDKIKIINLSILKLIKELELLKKIIRLGNIFSKK